MLIFIAFLLPLWMRPFVLIVESIEIPNTILLVSKWLKNHILQFKANITTLRVFNDLFYGYWLKWREMHGPSEYFTVWSCPLLLWWVNCPVITSLLLSDSWKSNSMLPRSPDTDFICCSALPDLGTTDTSALFREPMIHQLYSSCVTTRTTIYSLCQISDNKLTGGQISQQII